MFNERFIGIKTFFVGAISIISSKLGILAPIIFGLFLIVIADYISGICASAVEGKLSSSVGYRGILKKLSYFMAVGVAITVDWLIITCSQSIGIDISFKAFLSVLVSVWLILNELLSILENINRMGVRIPKFLEEAIIYLIGNVEKKGDIKGENNLD
ncbi:MAG: phage holin family protein [Oscillospiraceae bacterium]